MKRNDAERHMLEDFDENVPQRFPIRDVSVTDFDWVARSIFANRVLVNRSISGAITCAALN